MIKKVCYSILILLFLVVSTSIAGAAKTHKFINDRIAEIHGISGYKLFELNEPKVSFKVPSNWLQGKKRSLEYDIYAGGTEINFIGPIESSSNSGYTGLIIRIVPKGMTLNRYFKQLLASRGGAKTKVRSRKNIKVNGMNAKEAIITYDTFRPSWTIESKKVVSKMIVMVIEGEDNFYDITYGSSKTDYDLYIEAFNKIKETISSQNQ